MSNSQKKNEVEKSMSAQTGEPVTAGTALVTGASRGIGLAIASALASDGWNLVLTCSKTLPALRSLAADLESQYRVEVRSMLCDVGDPEQVRTLFRNIPSLDLLVNNAGISYVGVLQDMTDEQWDRVISVDLSSVFYTVRAAVPLFLKKQYPSAADGAPAVNTSLSAADASPAPDNSLSAADDSPAPDNSLPPAVGAPAAMSNSSVQVRIEKNVPGRIINISSVWGAVGASCEAAYSAAKGGVNAFTKALAKELAPSGIPVNAIACGCVDTVMNDNLSLEEKHALTEGIPAGRFAQPAEIAQAVLQLVHAPAYLTGQIITVDGGWI